MEYYESNCDKCGHLWRWVGYKTGFAPGAAEYNRQKGKVCPRCGHDNAKVDLDHSSPDAKALDGALGNVLGSLFKGDKKP